MKKTLILTLIIFISFFCGNNVNACDTYDLVLEFLQVSGSPIDFIELQDSNETIYTFEVPPNLSLTLAMMNDCWENRNSHIRVEFYENCHTGQLVVTNFECTTDPID